jgi:hypothetical protein
MILGKLATGAWVFSRGRKSDFLPVESHSLIPPMILGSAMVARGEVGFLIANLAEERGVFDSEGDARGDSKDREADSGVSDIFLIVIWAVVICTILGPVAVGILVRRGKMPH